MTKLEIKMLKLLAELRLWGSFDDAIKRRPELAKALREIDKMMAETVGQPDRNGQRHGR